MRCRPAETGGVVGSAVLLASHLFGLDDPDVIVSLGVLFGFAPAAVTWLVELLRMPHA